MSFEFHRWTFVILFVLFGSLSAIGFDQMNRSKQRTQRKIQKTEKRLQQLPRTHKFDARRLGLMCELAKAYEQINKMEASKSLQASIIQMFQRIQQQQPSPQLLHIAACESHSI